MLKRGGSLLLLLLLLCLVACGGSGSSSPVAVAPPLAVAPITPSNPNPVNVFTTPSGVSLPVDPGFVTRDLDADPEVDPGLSGVSLAVNVPLQNGVSMPYGLTMQKTSVVVGQSGPSWAEAGLRMLIGSDSSLLFKGILGSPRGVISEGDGYVVSDNSKTGRLWRVPNSGSPTIITTGLGRPLDVAADGNDFIVTDYKVRLVKVNGSTGATTLITNQGLGAVYGVGRIRAGEYVVSDTVGGRLLRVKSTGEVSVIAGTGVGHPRGIWVESETSFVVADYGYVLGWGRLIRVKSTGEVSVIMAEGLGNPAGVTQVSAGKFAVSDYTGNRVVMVDEQLPVVGNGQIQIVDADKIDGIPMTVGESKTLTAIAKDDQGNDLSSQVEWRNIKQDIIGRGANLTYQAKAPEAPLKIDLETISASLGANFKGDPARVTFTVSTADVKMAPHAKLLPDEAKDWLSNLDYEKGTLDILVKPTLPTLIAGDTIVGANATLPPVKILSVNKSQDKFKLTIGPATAIDLIRQGRFEVEIVEPTASLRQGDQSAVSLVPRVLETPINLQLANFEADLINPIQESNQFTPPNPWSFFNNMNANSTFSASLKYFFSLSYNGYLKSILEFNNDYNPFEGVKLFDTTLTSEIVARTGLSASAFYKLEAVYPKEIKIPGILPLEARINLPGALSWIWINVILTAKIEVIPTIEVSLENAKIGLQGTIKSTNIMKYDGGSRNWSFPDPVVTQDIRPILEGGQLDLTGSLEVALRPELEARLWSVPIGLKTGLRFYVLGQTASDYAIEIKQPPQERRSFRRAETIPLKAYANGSRKIDFTAGLGWTLGEAESQPSCNEETFDDRIRTDTGGTIAYVDPGEQSQVVSLQANPTPFYQAGGSYSDVAELKKKIVAVAANKKLDGTFGLDKATEIHHMPAKCTYLKKLKLNNSNFGEGRGPAILMDIEDHEETKSHSSPVTRIGSYNNLQQNLILENPFRTLNFQKAMELDITDVETNSEIKYAYDVAIGQMRTYAQKIIPNLSLR